MAEQDIEENLVSKLVIVRLVLSGALVAIAVAEIFGLSASTGHEVVAGSIGAVAVLGLKLFHLI